MQRAIIYVFSGTKNTIVTANLLKDSLDLRNVQTTVFEIRKPFGDFPDPNDFDFVGFSYPVHAFNIPEVLIRFVRQLPDAKKKAFIVKTSGEPYAANNASSYKLRGLLRKKGFDVVLDRHLLMPYNIMFRYNDNITKQMLLTNRALCELTAKQLLGGVIFKPDFALRHCLVSLLLRFIWPAARFNGLFYRVHKDKCNNCMKCVKSCPTQNITYSNDRFHFGSSCAMCMRCVMHCPTGAVNPGLITPLKVNGAYNFNRILNDPAILGDYINEDTKGYFRLFRNYFINAQQELSEYGQTIPHHKNNEDESLDSLITALDVIEEEEDELCEENY